MDVFGVMILLPSLDSPQLEASIDKSNILTVLSELKSADRVDAALEEKSKQVPTEAKIMIRAISRKCLLFILKGSFAIVHLDWR